MPAKLDQHTDTEQLHIMVPRSWLTRIEDWRRRQPETLTKSQAIRLLVERAIEADQRTPNRKITSAA